MTRETLRTEISGMEGTMAMADRGSLTRRLLGLAVLAAACAGGGAASAAGDGMAQERASHEGAGADAGVVVLEVPGSDGAVVLRIRLKAEISAGSSIVLVSLPDGRPVGSIYPYGREARIDDEYQMVVPPSAVKTGPDGVRRLTIQARTGSRDVESAVPLSPDRAPLIELAR